MDPQSIRFDGAVFARHVRLTPLKTSDGFFSALEIALFTPEGFEPFELGSLKAPGSVGSEDEQHLDNCIGRENHGTGVADWRSHVEQSAADFNLNGAYDVYDMSFTMSKLDGGTRRTGDVSGSICVEPACRDVREGQVVEICVRVRDACNVNAMGSLVHFDASACEFVKDSLDVSGRAPAMLDKSGHFSFGDQRDSVNIALVNKGDQELYGGTGEIATFKVRAKRDGRLDFEWQAWLVGPEQDFVSFSGA